VVVLMGEPLKIHVSYGAARPVRPVLSVAIKTVHGVPIFNMSDRDAQQLAACAPAAQGTVICEVPEIPLLPGNYLVDLALGDTASELDVIADAISFEVLPADVLGTGRLPSPVHGPIFCKADWRFSPEPPNSELGEENRSDYANQPEDYQRDRRAN
jgi:lipopolysaccharide transport system ATP-binding protein